MKQTYLLCLALLSFAFSQAQTIEIPDANFKDALVNYDVADLYGNYTYGNDVDTNNDGEIQVSEAEAVIGLDIFPSGITDLTGIEYFTNLVNLDAPNGLTSLNVTQNVFLEQLYCGNNQLTTLDITQNVNLLRFSCRSNQLTSLDVSQNVNLEELNFGYNQLTSIDLSQNINLEELIFENNQLTNIDISNSPYIRELFCSQNQLTNIDVSQNPYLRFFDCSQNEITTIDTSLNNSLLEFNCSNNLLTDIDTSQNSNLESLNCSNNPLTNLNIKNGVIIEYATSTYSINITNTPNLSHICVDEGELVGIQNLVISKGYDDCVVNSYCSFGPGGELFEITGYNKLDSDANGCDNQDIDFPQLEITINDGTTSGSFIANNSGAYNIPIADGSYTLTPVLENPDYFNISPSSFTLDFFSDPNPYNQDFCITPNGTKNDLEIVIIPLEQARPGFDADYELVYKNKGNTTLSGMLSLDFQDDFMNLVVANPSVDTQTISNLSWNYVDLQPFESRSIFLTMNINTPTDPDFPVYGDDVLDFVASINPVSGDEIPDDNTFDLNQRVLNSYDPNDITCLEGDVIAPEKVGDFVHYVIRFENTGTASAINIVVKDEIDVNKYDISTLKPIAGSHSFVTRIKEENSVEFIFENINLPENDANNDGYVSFKIKTQPTLVLGDTFSNTAEIYFDFNAPIITNTAVTTVEEPLSVSDYELDRNITLYPNPSNGTIELKNKSGEFLNYAEVINVNGSVIYELSLDTTSFSNSISLKLESGIYFFKLYTDKGSVTKKLIIK